MGARRSLTEMQPFSVGVMVVMMVIMLVMIVMTVVVVVWLAFDSNLAFAAAAYVAHCQTTSNSLMRMSSPPEIWIW